ncbi:hypothetical protein N7495_002902 [Penicillium taxi]|uniref:uncharacterized protein n=1 Tax=Penicillium taxi TaxID=168475 RepID=UPI0025458798|nr:uncharacterized protein N7495_002902 [Penicillium taxi]KAJ5902374.1 hypothetical protein N7495_002902 [Penicillium taxi]
MKSTGGASRSSSLLSAASGSFTESVRSAALKENKDCWVCGSLEPEIAHVFAKADSRIEIWRELGLVDFLPCGLLNSIPLCPNCHSQYDSSDPGLTIIPYDIAYFISFEKKDQARRRKAGKKVPRIIPSNQQYAAHCHAKFSNRYNDEEAEKAGLYRAVFLKEYLVPRVIEFGKGACAFLTNPKPWYGAPLALFNQAFLASISPRASAWLDMKTHDQLQELRVLYYRNLVEEEEGQGPESPGDGGDAPSDGGHGDGEDDNGQEPSKRKRAEEDQPPTQIKNQKTKKHNAHVELQYCRQGFINTSLYEMVEQWVESVQ